MGDKVRNKERAGEKEEWEYRYSQKGCRLWYLLYNVQT